MRPASPNRVSLCLVTVLIIGLIGGLIGLSGAAGCRRRTAEIAEYKDPHPLPAEPLVVDAPTIGKHGGRFVLAETGNPRTFNGMMANETSSTNITTRNLFSYLVDFDNGAQQFGPGIAKSWEVAPDGVTWTFHLRQGAKFSDGHPITAEDVLFSAQVALDETLHPAVQDQLKMGGKPFDFSAPDPLTVVIKTPAPNAAVLISVFDLQIMPKHVLEPAYKSGTFASGYNVNTPPDQIVSSGPWRVTQYVPGEKTVLGRNPYWFGVDKANQRLPYLNELVFLVVPDQDAADLRFRSGGLDGLDNVKPENYKWYEDHQKDGNFTLYDLGPALNSNFFWFNLNRVQKPTPGKKLGNPLVDQVKYAWFSNPVFRRAVSMAVDRDAMIPSIFFGNGQKSWSVASEGNRIWHTPGLVHYDYNVAESKRLLASLGFKDGNGDGMLEDTRGNPIAFSLKTNSENVIRIAMANFIKDDLAKVGIKMTLVPVDFNTLITNLRNDFQYESILLGSQSGVPPDPANAQNFFRSSGISHYWFIRQEKPATPEEARIDHLMDTIIATLDLEGRKAAFKELQTIWNEQGWLVWLPILKVKLPMSNRFGNAQPSIMAHRLLWNIDRVYVK
jgi:peptide/nickel transport system substrate-binding protein